MADYLKYNRRSGAGGDDDAQHAYVRMVRGGQRMTCTRKDPDQKIQYRLISSKL